jgi:hypothetical protein
MRRLTIGLIAIVLGVYAVKALSLFILAAAQ